MRVLSNAIALASASAHAVKAGGYAAVAPYPVTRTAHWTEWDSRAAVREGFKGSSVVFACVWRYMQTIAAIPWMTSEWVGPKSGTTGGEWLPVDDHPLTERIENPNPHMSRGVFMERRVAHLFLAGNSPVQLLGVGEGSRKRPPAEMIPLDPAIVKPIPDPVDFIAGWQLTGSLSGDNLSPDEVMHDMFVDPEDPYWGMSPLQAAGRAVDTDTEAARWNKQSMQNRAVPDAVVTYDHDLNPVQHKQALQELSSNYAGPSSARGMMVFGKKASVTRLGLSAVEMDFIASRKFNREEICAVFRTPPVVAGFFDDATLANADVSWKMYYQGSVVPVLDLLRGGMQRKLVPLYAKPGQRLAVFYDVSAVEAMQKNYAEKAKTALDLFRMGVPGQEINRRLEMDLVPWDGWEVSYLPANTVAASDMNGDREDADGVL